MAVRDERGVGLLFEAMRGVVTLAVAGFKAFDGLRFASLLR